MSQACSSAPSGLPGPHTGGPPTALTHDGQQVKRTDLEGKQLAGSAAETPVPGKYPANVMLVRSPTTFTCNTGRLSPRLTDSSMCKHCHRPGLPDAHGGGAAPGVCARIALAESSSAKSSLRHC